MCEREGWRAVQEGRGVEAEGVREGRCCPGGRCVHTVAEAEGTSLIMGGVRTRAWSETCLRDPGSGCPYEDPLLCPLV